MARKKKKTRKEIRTRLSFLAAALFILIIIVFQGVRFLDSPGGRVFLLDIGFDGKYGSVRKDINSRIVRVLMENGVKKSSLEIIPSEKGRGYIIKAPLAGNRSLIKINSSIHEAVEGMGARVRKCVEKDSGRSLDMEIGTGRLATHRCLIRKSEEAEPANCRIALVVDDFGYFFNDMVRDFIELDAGITISVIPGLEHSIRICREALKADRAYICHLPMEPEGGGCGEEYCVRVSMDDSQIRRITEEALGTTPGVTGMNNHMGSRATSDRRVMAAVLGICKERELFFFDSLTSSNSVVSEMAERIGLPVLANDIFLDNRGADIRGNMLKLMEKAERKGYAAGIMHVKRESLKQLKWMISETRKRGIEFVTLKDLISMIKGKEA